MNVKCKLKELMDKEGISQLQLASETGLSPATIGKLYRDQFERIDKNTIISLCVHFKCTLTDLLELVE